MKSKEYRSRFEKKVAAFLTANKIGFEYERCSFLYYLPTKGRCSDCSSGRVLKEGTYHPDFGLLFDNRVFLESKGKFTSRDRTKMIAIKSQHPYLDIRLLFMRDNFLNKNSKTRYSVWAQENGYKYHVSSTGEIPSQWLKEFKSVRSRKR